MLRLRGSATSQSVAQILSLTDKQVEASAFTRTNKRENWIHAKPQSLPPAAADDGHHVPRLGELQRLPARGACVGTRPARPIDRIVLRGRVQVSTSVSRRAQGTALRVSHAEGTGSRWARAAPRGGRELPRLWTFAWRRYLPVREELKTA